MDDVESDHPGVQTPQPSGDPGLLSLSKLRASSQYRLASCFPVRTPSHTQRLI